jgi:hypothetical protein
MISPAKSGMTRQQPDLGADGALGCLLIFCCKKPEEPLDIG